MAPMAFAPKQQDEKPKQKPAAGPAQQKGGEQDVSAQPIESVVQEHGPADEVQMQRGEGGHHVHSKHGGKSHHSDHGSAEEAHAHMGKALGIGMGEQSSEQSHPPKQEHGLPGMAHGGGSGSY